ncbi:hypothetical protein PVAND_006595 [Polypedilum vanderplanki]|uniref:Uncharacterized protein n=1 Tax=Polypedilum vanderplanki TaxID=319348 RepID=A0A9J6C460_POLVA|nr:hypothetical protein PVAND_006595 [Polypedilum vanderplanki]
MSKSSVHRSKEILESENPNWYHPPDHSWYRSNEEEDDDERMERMPRPFDRNAYERSTYGPPYDKREARNYQGFDRNDRRLYDKRSKYYRSYNRSEYDPYDMPPNRGGKLRKEYDDYEKCFERGARETRSAREYLLKKNKEVLIVMNHMRVQVECIV